MNDVNKNNSAENEAAQTVGESELEAVAGGGLIPCTFTHADSPTHKTVNGVVWAKCNTRCLLCACRWTDICVDRWHKMEHFIDNIWVPSPRSDSGHDAPKLAIRI